MKRFLKNLLFYLLVLLIPLGAFVAVAETRENPYHNAFTAALVDKYDRLTSLEGQKIVFVGGSSLAFGLRCDLVERELGLPAVNMGTYAALGTKAMLEISLSGIGRGDLVVVAPELDPQTYSDYFNADVLWEAVCERRGLIARLSFDEQVSMAYNYFDFSLDRIRLSGQTVSADDLYARTSFNAYGDIAFPRGENLMPGGRDASAPVSLDGLANDAFFTMMADFTEKARGKGADVFFAFPPVNEKAVAYTVEEEAAFLAALTERLSCPVLGTPRDTTYAAGYFYNTNYHPNDAGAVLHTATMIGLLKRALGDGSPTDIAVPDPPAVEEPITGEDGNARFFTVTEIGGNLLLSGTTDEGRAQMTLTLPLFVDGRRVAGVLSGCFAGCDRLTEVTVPDGYRTFETGCFAAPALGTVRIGIRDPGRTGIPNAGLFDGTPEGLRVVIPADRYAAFVSNYSWRVYRRYFVKEGEE